MDYKKLGSNIKKVRRDKNITQEKLAESINVSAVFISQIESGNSIPSLETIYNISNFLNISIDYLINSDDKEQTLLEIDNMKLVTELENINSKISILIKSIKAE